MRRRNRGHCRHADRRDALTSRYVPQGEGRPRTSFRLEAVFSEAPVGPLPPLAEPLGNAD
jgi:hypothetical protein